MENNDKAYKVAYNLVAYLNSAFRAGLTDAVIAAMTNPATTTVLKTTIAALVMPARQQWIQREINSQIDRAVRCGVLTSANVETARAAGTFAALITAIQSNSQASTVDTKAQVHVPWAL